jgi:hypothetical protein
MSGGKSDRRGISRWLGEERQTDCLTCAEFEVLASSPPRDRAEKVASCRSRGRPRKFLHGDDTSGWRVESDVCRLRAEEEGESNLAIQRIAVTRGTPAASAPGAPREPIR